MSPKKTKTETLEETSTALETSSTEVPGEDTAENTLETAASEWAADPIAVGHVDESLQDAAIEASGALSDAEELSDESEENTTEEPAQVAFISSPYDLGGATDIAAAQRSDEELELDEVPGDEFDHEEETIVAEALTEEAPAAEMAVSEAVALESLAQEMMGAVEETPANIEAAAAQDLAEDAAIAEEDEISDEMEDETPLILADDAEMAETLTRLQAKMDLEAAESAKLLEAQAAIDSKDAKQLLADQIAEDEALERQMAEEDEAENDPELIAALPREPEEDESGNLDLTEMESCIESILFMVEKPMSAKKLQELLGPDMSLSYFEEALQNLMKRYQKRFHGFELVEIANGYQFRTKIARAPLAKKLAKKLAKIQTQRLSTGAMESLAIIAYKQPVMKDDIDKIRGVDSSHFIRGLLDKKLIKITGRSELPGRPMLYATTNEFLEVFSLKSLDSMPPLKELESMIPGSESGNADDADPRVVKMRALVEEMNSDTSVSLLYDAKDDDAFLTEIRERVKSIEIVTPTLQAQDDEAEAMKTAGKVRAKKIAAGEIDEQAENFATAVNNAEEGKSAEFPLE